MSKAAGKTRRAQGLTDPLEARLNAQIPSDVLRPPSRADFDSEKMDIPGRRKQKYDPLSDAIGSSVYYHKMVWPEWFCRMVNGVQYKLVVDRYYQEKKLAIDMKLTGSAKTLIPLKKELLEAHGIQYFHLTDMDSINDMLAQIQEQ